MAADDTEPLDAGSAPRDPEELEASSVATSAEISPQTSLGAVHLTVADLERSIAYYRQSIGLELLRKGDGSASIGAAGHELLVLVELPGAAPSDGRTGLYHFALLVPERADLARWLAHAGRDHVQLVGLSDHYVSEALYLRDPDGHGIEIYWDRPREVWQGQVGSSHDDAAAGRRQPVRRAGRPGHRAVRRAAGGHGDGPRAPEGAEIDATRASFATCSGSR